MDLNRGFFFITQGIAKKMKEQWRRSHCKCWIHVGQAGNQSDSFIRLLHAKSRLHSLTQHLAMELADAKIRVNAVSPSVVATPVYDKVFGGKARQLKP